MNTEGIKDAHHAQGDRFGSGVSGQQEQFSHLCSRTDPLPGVIALVPAQVWSSRKCKYIKKLSSPFFENIQCFPMSFPLVS